MFNSMLLLQSFGAWSLQAIGKGTPLMFFLSAFPLFIGLVSNDYLVPTVQAAWKVRTLPAGEVSLWTYAIGQASCLFSGTLLFIGVLEFFVPLVSATHVTLTLPEPLADRAYRCGSRRPHHSHNHSRHLVHTAFRFLSLLHNDSGEMLSSALSLYWESSACS